MTRRFSKVFTSAAVLLSLAIGCASSNGSNGDGTDVDSGVLVDAGGKKLDAGKAIIDSGNSVKDSGNVVVEDPDTGPVTILDAGTALIDTGILGVIDAGPKPDSGVIKSDAGLVCAPDTAAVASFTGGGYHPAGRVAGACNIASLTTACFSATATNTTCNTFLTNNAACNTCILSTRTSTKWGPLVDGSINIPGCLELKAPGAAGTLCANALQDNYDCQDTACTNNCPIPASSSDPGYSAAVAAFNTCANSAIAGSCKAYVDKAFAANGKCVNVLGYSDGGTAGLATNDCFQKTVGGVAETSNAYLARFIGIFCGP